MKAMPPSTLVVWISVSAVAQQRTTSVPQLSQLENVRYIDWQNGHVRDRIRDRPGIEFSYVEDVILEPYGRIYWHAPTDLLV